jgi:DNA-binding CsgD family transcriptional regulator
MPALPNVMTVGMLACLLERDDALELADQLLARARRGDGGLLLIEGHAGVGKTRLVSAIAERATSAGLAVHAARGHELEEELPFGVLRQVLEAPLRAVSAGERAALFAGSARPAEVVFHGSSSGAPADPMSIVHALFWLTVNLTDRSPAVLLVDDAHWSDLPSLRWLHYLSRRLTDLPVLVVVACRQAEETRATDLLDALRESESTHSSRLEPLGVCSVARLLTARLGSTGDRFAVACHRATGGNPFLLTELVRQICAQGLAPTDSVARRVPDLVCPTVSDSVSARLRRIGPKAVAVARAVAVLGVRGRLDQVASLAAVPIAVAATESDRLRRNGILDTTARTAFLHPLVATAVRQEIPTATRAVMHGRAARLLAGAGAPTAQVAAQLLVAAPTGDAWVVDQLRLAAREALAAGAADIATSYLRRAAEEPPEPTSRGQVHHEWGTATALLDPRAAVSHFAIARREAEDDAARCSATLGLAKSLAHSDRVSDAVRVLASTQSIMDDSARGVRLRTEQLLWSAWWAGHDRPHERSEQLATLAATTGEPAVHVLLAWERMVSGAPAEQALTLAGQVLADGVDWIDDDLNFEIPCILTQVFLFSDHVDRAVTLFGAGLAELDKRGWHGTHRSFLHALRANAFYRRGDLIDAEVDARTAWRLMDDLGPDVPSWWWSVATLVQVLTARGDLTAAERLAASTDLGGPRREALVLPDPLAVRGELRLATGRLTEAAADLDAAGELLEGHGCANPSWSPWRMDLALALRVQDPEAAVSHAQQALRRARRFGRPWVLGRALRTLGLLTPGSDGVDLLAEAVRTLAGSAARYEHARALVDWGAALRRANHRASAREPLRAGLDLADRCGATGLATSARQELAAAGARPRRTRLAGPAALTPSEQRVATLAAEGLANPEIASTLLITRKTVEKHLAATYLKLGIRTRRDLADALR